jgi:plastocyanin
VTTTSKIRGLAMVVLLLAGCDGGSVLTVDAGLDAGGRDSGAVDANAGDANHVDANAVDANAVDASTGEDANVDAAVDPGSDAGFEAGVVVVDAGDDAAIVSLDAGTDAAIVPVDAATSSDDASTAARDAGADSGTDAGTDAGSDAGAPAINGCMRATALDMTSSAAAIVTFGTGGLTYTPACIVVSVGTSVTFNGNFSFHPLQGGTVVAGVLMPATSGPFVPATSTGTTRTFVMTSAGTFPYYCAFHGGFGMAGVVYVE